MITRRAAVLAALTTLLGQVNIRGYQANGSNPGPARATLRIDLDQWESITVQLGKESTVVTSADVFRILKG